MDRISIINANLNDYVINNKEVKKLVKKKIEKAMDKLSEAYQELGQHM